MSLNLKPVATENTKISTITCIKVNIIVTWYGVVKMAEGYEPLLTSKGEDNLSVTNIATLNARPKMSFGYHHNWLPQHMRQDIVLFHLVDPLASQTHPSSLAKSSASEAAPP